MMDSLNTLHLKKEMIELLNNRYRVEYYHDIFKLTFRIKVTDLLTGVSAKDTFYDCELIQNDSHDRVLTAIKTCIETIKKEKENEST